MQVYNIKGENVDKGNITHIAYLPYSLINHYESILLFAV